MPREHCRIYSVYGIKYLEFEIKNNKGIWWMPWHMKAMKDVVRCDKPRGDANNL